MATGSPFTERAGVDLHIHTSASDGTDDPVSVMDLCIELNVGVVAVTDHDTLNALDAAENAGRERGITVVRGIEISAGFETRSIHILGLGITEPDSAFLEMLRKIRDGRDNRNPRILRKLGQLGYPLADADVRQCAGGEILGRLHIAQAMVNRGYVRTVDQAFRHFLVRGGRAYVERFRPDAAEAIAAIRRIGGVPVLAHPGLLPFDKDLLRLESWITQLQSLGMEGIESHYYGHSDEMFRFLTGVAERHGLLVSGGSDYHGGHKPNQLGRGCCGRRITRDFSGPMLERLGIPSVMVRS